MSFDFNKFTNSGANLLAAASTTTSIEITKIYCYSEELDSDEVMTQTTDWFESQPSIMNNVIAKVVSIGHDPVEYDPATTTSSAARIVVNLALSPAVSESANVKSICIFGRKVIDDIAYDEVSFICAIDESGIVIPYTSVPTSISVSFGFSFNPDAEITAFESVSNYLLYSEVARFMTTHSATSATSGDNQTIYGQKTFEDNVILHSNFAVNSEGSSLRIANFGDYGCPSIWCDSNSEYLLRIQDYQENYSPVQFVGEDGHLVIHTDGLGSTNESYITLSNDILPKNALSTSLGSIIFPWADVSTNILNVNDLVSINHRITVHSDLVPLTSESIGTSSKPFGNVYCTALSVSNLTVRGSIVEYATKFQTAVNTQPEVNSTISVAVGQEVYAWGTNEDFGGLTLWPGKKITITANSLRNAKRRTHNVAGVGGYESNYNVGSYYLPAGTYVVLDEILFEGDQTICPVRLQRIA